MGQQPPLRGGLPPLGRCLRGAPVRCRQLLPQGRVAHGARPAPLCRISPPPRPSIWRGAQKGETHLCRRPRDVCLIIARAGLRTPKLPLRLCHIPRAACAYKIDCFVSFPRFASLNTMSTKQLFCIIRNFFRFKPLCMLPCESVLKCACLGAGT